LKRIGGFFFLFVLLTAGFYLQAQAAPSTHVTDPAALRPPPGARVAIYEFSDMECPDCARANPLLMEAVAKYHIPWVRRDFPLPYHAWSFDGAVDARWFDTKSKKLGNDFRDAVFADQANIQTPEQLRAFAEEFAARHKLTLPFVVDPQGKLAAAVKADYALGQRIGVEHTPTIWVVTNKTSGVPFVEVVDRSHLYEIIDEALAETAHPAAHASRAKDPVATRPE
jgi:protein-disulfide isomerase